MTGMCNRDVNGILLFFYIYRTNHVIFTFIICINLQNFFTVNDLCPIVYKIKETVKFIIVPKKI